MPIRAAYGFKPSSLDHRDLKFGVTAPTALPPVVDLSTAINWVYDQEQQSSCVGNSTTSLIRFRRLQQKLPEIDPSRDFIYWQARAIENDTTRDEGCQIRSAMQAVSKAGYCPESMFPFNTHDVFTAPSTEACNNASHNLVTEYVTINQDHNSLRASLAANTPYVCGIEVCQSFESNQVAQTGLVPMPTNSDPVVGGHAVFCVGYNDQTQYYKFLNSWGADWGQKGYFFLPYAFVESADLTTDFFTINKFVTLAGAPAPSKDTFIQEALEYIENEAKSIGL
jgi:C1A family cysteine protease